MNNSLLNKIRKDFNYLNKEELGKNIIYLDNAATTQRPKQVLDDLCKYYNYSNANPHRGAHFLSVSSTIMYDEARECVRRFINAKDSSSIIFTRSATESLNLVAYSYGLNYIKEGDEILISILEHHSNLCTWQYVAKKTGAKLKYVYLDENMQLDMNDFEQKLNEKVKLVSITAASNTVGTCPDVHKICKLSHLNGSKILIDAAQLALHEKIDVQDMDCDFLVFSGHKMCAEYGIGVLYAKKEILENMEPYNYGGDMVEYVYEQETTYAPIPNKFEAGTQNVGGAVSLMSAMKYLENIGFDNIVKHEKVLTDYMIDLASEYKFLDIYTTKSEKRSPIMLFNFKDIHPHDVSTILDSCGIAIRSGHHCCAPLHHYLGINSTCRASIAFYNTKEEIDQFIKALPKVAEVFGYGY